MGKLERPTFFPPPEAADDDGLVLLGGQLSVEWLLDAYRHGIFPWPLVTDDWDLLAWFSPSPRAVLELDRFHVPRRVARRLRCGRYRVTCNRDFAGVVAGCAGPRLADSGTWITPAMAHAYVRLHELGYAHSVEVYLEDVLVGGLYGVALGGLFAGESMFHRATDASKIALARLVGHLTARGYQLFDVQQATPHTLRMGAIEIPRREYLRRLAAVRDLDVTFAAEEWVDESHAELADG